MIGEKIILIFVVALVANTKALGVNVNLLSEKSAPQWTVNVELEEPIKSYEKVGITGDAPFLGSWSTNRTIMLNKTEESPTKWMGSIQIPTNFTSSVKYRFFIGMANSTGGKLRIHKWETHLNGRTVNLTADKSLETTDRFGIIGDVKRVNQGWLNSGRIVQFKLFREPLKLKKSYGDRKIFVKITPVGYNSQKLQNYNESLGLAHIEYVRVEYGNSSIRYQPEEGVLFEKIGNLIFHITTGDLKNVAFNFTISVENEEDPEKKDIIGYQYIYPERINSTTGDIDLDLMSPENKQNSVGSIQLKFLLIKPQTSMRLNFKNAFNNYWSKSWTKLDVLHRGVGKSFKTADNAAPVTENTVKTMKEALNEGADMVEFDVQLTKDLFAIIYHDDFVLTSKSGKKPSSKDDLTEVNIKDVNYEELKNLETYHFVNQELVKYPTHNEETDKDHALFPLFEDLLTKVNHTLAYDIEIKPSIQPDLDENQYIDIIIDVMLRKGCGRLSVISSVDADLITLMQFKQNMHPVMLIGYGIPNGFLDIRSSNLENMISGAQGMEWLGIIPHASYFWSGKGDLIKLATDLDVKMIIWGDDSKKSVDYFKSYNVTGVIYSLRDIMIPDENGNLFKKQKGMPEYFEKHCACRNVTDEYVIDEDESSSSCLLCADVST
ncbi:glycerophosphocholine phosphodiesterase GPCPD1-like [Episyrphus balteatus]|uniref:glycerophosphocholine phosphodiesterase GPCPD1-like n=1 Tax=Episyrphus balteatus TaxID=286459 RepID=UPI002486ACA8|nr:glycerophosphocholine phosphodiesterase GPCPD1-like [Episyrphus balteatus]